MAHTRTDQLGPYGRWRTRASWRGVREMHTNHLVGATAPGRPRINKFYVYAMSLGISMA